MNLYHIYKINQFVKNIGILFLIDGSPNPTFKIITSVLDKLTEMKDNNISKR
jgi:hypothetical protein